MNLIYLGENWISVKLFLDQLYTISKLCHWDFNLSSLFPEFTFLTTMLYHLQLPIYVWSPPAKNIKKNTFCIVFSVHKLLSHMLAFLIITRPLRNKYYRKYYYLILQMRKPRFRDIRIFILLTNGGGDPQIHFFLFQVPCSFLRDIELLGKL